MTVKAGAGTPTSELRSKRRRGAESANTVRSLRPHCVNGHEYTPENTRLRSNGNRVCRTCDKERIRRRRGGIITLECFLCGSTYAITYETMIRNERRGTPLRCRSCVRRPTFEPRSLVVTKRQHHEYWLAGGLTGDKNNPGPADRGKPLRWPEIMEIAAGLEAWLDEASS